MEEWGDLDARLERKKRIKLRRQQRELKKQQMELEMLAKERAKLMRRCDEMGREDQLSVAMMRWDTQKERQQRREIQREEDMAVYADVAKVRQRAKQLGLSLETRGVSGKERLEALQTRVETREAALEVAAQAKQRLDALPKKRGRVRRVLESYFSSSVEKKVERAVYEQRCDSLADLLDPKVSGKQASASLLNQESQNGFTPVLCAIYRRDRTLLRRLLELGASPNFETSTGVTPLIACVQVDDVVALHILTEFRVDLEYETQRGVKALLLAAEKGRNAVLKALLRLGADVDDTNADGRTALIQAAICRHYGTTKTLLAFNASKTLVDNSGRSALEWARAGKAALIATLLESSTSSKSLMALIRAQDEREADAPNRLVQDVERQRSEEPGTIAMEAALREGQVARILELLSIEDAGYGPNYETSTGETPLLVVTKHGAIEDILACLGMKCCVAQSNRFGVNALMKAAYHGTLPTMRLLVGAGCSLWTRDFQGIDTLRHLHDNEHLGTVSSLIKEFGADQPPRLVLSQPVEDTTALRVFLDSRKELKQAQEVDGDVSENARHEHSGYVIDFSLDKIDGVETEKLHKWSIRRRVLRGDKKRNSTFEIERHKTWLYAQHGRRNGLVAPLPHDKAGRFKYPPCDNCHGSRSRKRCFLCEQVLCDRCHARLHELPHRRHHEYEELSPTLMVGAQELEVVIANQQESLQGSLQRSLSCVGAIKRIMSVELTSTQQPEFDFEVEKYNRKQRIIREKEIAHMQIDVPVAAAKHASKAGEAEIYTYPADIELADLYITQGKLSKARSLMEAIKPVIEESLGYSHPTMLKLHIRIARIEQYGGDLEKSLDTIRTALGTFEGSVPPDQKDLLVAQDLALQILDTLARYQDAVNVCRRLVRMRTSGLAASHLLVHFALARLDEFVAKRELEGMRKVDLLLLEKAASSAERAEELRVEEERRLKTVRTLLLEQQPPDLFDSFLAFAKREFAEDMVRFWTAVETAKTTIDETDTKAFRAAVVSVFLTYIKSRRIRITTAVQRKKMKKLITTPGKKLPRTIFDEVQALVFDVVYRRVYARFETA